MGDGGKQQRDGAGVGLLEARGSHMVLRSGERKERPRTGRDPMEGNRVSNEMKYMSLR